MAINLAKLAGKDLELLIDRSGSMGTPDCANGATRWNHVAGQTAELATAALTVDDDGIYVGLFDDQLVEVPNADGNKVLAAFQQYRPRNGTDTAMAINARLEAYFERRDGKKGGMFSKGTPGLGDKVKPLILIVVTDGRPTQNSVKGLSSDGQKAVAQVITNATKRIKSRKEIGIFFVQVGYDKGATAFLQWLDDGLTSEGAAFDIVDAKTAEDAARMSIGQIVEAALND